MQRLRVQVQRIGPHFRTVLVRGEAGTEKELVARALHGTRPGADNRFVAGRATSFEDALEKCKSRTAAASPSTLFLEGVDDMSLEMQDRFLRRLEESTQGGLYGLRRTELRMIASTSEDLRMLVSTGRFRQELYQRLAVVEIVVPPLRERIEDLPELARHFLNRFARLYSRCVHEIADEAMDRIQRYPWPGNTSELERVLHEGVLQCDGEVLECRHLATLGEANDPEKSATGGGSCVRLQDVVEQHVLRVLKDCGGNKLRAAEVLGISRSTLYRMLDAGATPDILR